MISVAHASMEKNDVVLANVSPFYFIKVERLVYLYIYPASRKTLERDCVQVRAVLNHVRWRIHMGSDVRTNKDIMVAITVLSKDANLIDFRLRISRIHRRLIV